MWSAMAVVPAFILAVAAAGGGTISAAGRGVMQMLHCMSSAQTPSCRKVHALQSQGVVEVEVEVEAASEAWRFAGGADSGERKRRMMAGKNRAWPLLTCRWTRGTWTDASPARSAKMRAVYLLVALLAPASAFTLGLRARLGVRPVVMSAQGKRAALDEYVPKRLRDDEYMPEISEAEAAADEALSLWSQLIGDVPEDVTQEQMRAVFDKIDLDNSGTLEPEELQTALAEVGVEKSLEEVSAMTRMADTDNNGAVDYKEFLQLTEDAGIAPDGFEWGGTF